MSDIGYAFAPMVISLSGNLSDIAKTTSTWVNENKELAEKIAYGTGALIGLKVAVVASKFVFGGLFTVISATNKALLWYGAANIKASIATGIATTRTIAHNVALKAYRVAVIASTGATALMSGGMATLNALMTLNPIGLMVAGAAALVAVGYLIYDNWSSICDTVSDAAKWFKDMTGIDLSGMFDFIDPVIEKVKWLIDKIMALNKFTSEGLYSAGEYMVNTASDVSNYFFGEDDTKPAIQDKSKRFDLEVISQSDKINDTEIGFMDGSFTPAASPIKTSLKPETKKAIFTSSDTVTINVSVPEGSNSEEMIRITQEAIARNERQKELTIRQAFAQ